jgi:Domain of unknown function (DUF4383)
MPDQRTERGRGRAEPSPGAARLYALLAGALLALLGILGFFYDAGFSTGRDLAADDVAGTIVVNGWRNVVYLISGLLALGFASLRPRATAAALGAFYLGLGIWGLIVTDQDIGSILEILPLTNADNAFHLALGGLGVIAALVDGPLPKRTQRPERSPDKPSAERRRPRRDTA